MRYAVRLALVAAGLAALAGCAPGSPSQGEPQPETQPRTKTLTIGVTTQLQQMGVFAGQSTGGWTRSFSRPTERA